MSTTAPATIALASTSGMATEAARCGTRPSSMPASFTCGPKIRPATQPMPRPMNGTTRGPNEPKTPATAAMPEFRAKNGEPMDFWVATPRANTTAAPTS
ncbi:hypothetical protein, partial [Kutzneria sp. 744]|uniref:hypothetical protein n=1 Tax=Kutzneria sp. (strain 744) TaxID=345341 RepID=UPI0018DBE7D6